MMRPVCRWNCLINLHIQAVSCLLESALLKNCKLDCTKVEGLLGFVPVPPTCCGTILCRLNRQYLHEHRIIIIHTCCCFVNYSLDTYCTWQDKCRNDYNDATFPSCKRNSFLQLLQQHFGGNVKSAEVCFDQHNEELCINVFDNP